MNRLLDISAIIWYKVEYYTDIRCWHICITSNGMSRSIIQLKNDPINRLTIYIIRVIESLQDKESNRQKLAFHPPLLLSSTSTLEAALSLVIRARISLFRAAVFRPTRPRHHQIHSITRAYSINYFHFASMAFPFQWSSSPSPPRVDAVSTEGIPFQWNPPLSVRHWITFCIVSEI